MHACRRLAEISEACEIPFDDSAAVSQCLSVEHRAQVVSSNKCAAAWANAHKLEGAKETFRRVATVTQQLHEECGKLQSAVRAATPVLSYPLHPNRK